MKKITCAFLTICHYVVTFFGFGAASAVFLATPSQADLRLCNKTGSEISVAIGYKGQKDWRTEGWWNFRPTEDDNACKVLLVGPLRSRFYYVYAMDISKGGEWSGDAFLCTQPKEFTIDGIKDCIPRGFERTGFFEVDTQKQESWTIQLTDPDKDGS